MDPQEILEKIKNFPPDQTFNINGREMSVADLAAYARDKIQSRKFYQWEPYKWQKEFYDASIAHHQRLLSGGNRVGKTASQAYECVCHLTGEYPDWWEGRRFEKPINAWAASVTNELLRETIQEILLGKDGEAGLIPPDRLKGKPKMRQAGVSDVVDYILVRHKKGISKLSFKTYEQGWRKFQGAKLDYVWLDEEPEDFKVFTEALTRTLDSDGLLVVTFTPLLGWSKMVEHFKERFKMQIGWGAKTPHLDKKAMARMLESYPEHERDARAKGIPQLGEGRVFPHKEDTYICEPFEVPDYFAQIGGLDFGGVGVAAHPTAYVKAAWDRDNDIFYFTDEYKNAKETVVYHSKAIKSRGMWIPVAWPHDGFKAADQSGKSGKNFKDLYMDEGVNMLPDSARYAATEQSEERGGAQPVEPIVLEINQMIRSGQFKIFKTCRDLREEVMNLHRKDGKIVALRDDLFKAACYALMMKRYAMPNMQPRQRKRARPMFTI